jgi:hypothetical protein
VRAARVVRWVSCTRFPFPGVAVLPCESNPVSRFTHAYCMGLYSSDQTQELNLKVMPPIDFQSCLMAVNRLVYMHSLSSPPLRPIPLLSFAPVRDAVLPPLGSDRPSCSPHTSLLVRLFLDNSPPQGTRNVSRYRVYCPFHLGKSRLFFCVDHVHSSHSQRVRG